MGKFDKAEAASKSFGNVGKKDAEKATVIVLQNISNENLLDNPENGEDVDFTDDLELSMRENGFTDPIEVTDFEQEAGKYMILSGHRRRSAGVKVGFTVFPCLVRHFKNRHEVKNYMLSSNAQRDSARDPFLMSKRYKLHEQYLLEMGFKGSIRLEVAKRLGISVQQADRYNAMNKIILPIWDMVRAETLGFSSVQAMASHTEEEQNEILAIIQEADQTGIMLTREIMKILIDGYRAGKRTWAEIAAAEEAKEAENQESASVPEPAPKRKTTESNTEQPSSVEAVSSSESTVKKDSDEISQVGEPVQAEESGDLPEKAEVSDSEKSPYGLTKSEYPEESSSEKVSVPPPDPEAPYKPMSIWTDRDIEGKWPNLDEAARRQWILADQRKKMASSMKSEWLPDFVVFENKLIVEALEFYISNLESGVIELDHERNLQKEESMQPDLPVFKNNDQRTNWLRAYKDWGLWYRDDNIGVEYYKYDFKDGARLIAEVYQGACFFHLVGGSEPPKGSYGIGKWSRHEHYCKYPNSETELVEFLKELQKK